MFADKLKELRNKEGISQSALGKALNMSQQGIAKWETGSTSPNPEMLRKIADYFNVSVDYLLGKTDIKNPRPKNEDKITFDDFTYAMNEEAHELTDEEKDKLLELARFFKENRKKGRE